MQGSDLDRDAFVNQMTQFELGMIVARNSFEQWVIRCSTASGLVGYSPLEMLILHLIDYNTRPKRIADICFALKIEDTHLVSYALKKLVKGKLVESTRQGKDTVFTNTKEATRLVNEYRAVRKSILSRAFDSITKGTINLEEMADTMRAFASIYEQAARTVEIQDYGSA